jgi:glycosyltransferase involved in cell wall biosynthesis
MKKVVSIIVLSFNDERVLNAINSIRSSGKNLTDELEIIVIDGGSSLELLEDIQGILSENDQLHSEPDDGIFDALNKGLSCASGTYIGWIGSDDAYLPGFTFDYVIETLENFDLLICGTIHTKLGKPIRITPSRFIPTFQLLEDHLYFKNIASIRIPNFLTSIIF